MSVIREVIYLTVKFGYQRCHFFPILLDTHSTSIANRILHVRMHLKLMETVIEAELNAVYVKINWR